MSSIARAFDIARSNLTARLASAKSKTERQRKNYTDEFIIGEIKKIVEQRPTYGYRRVTAVLNRKFKHDCTPRVNPKRIYRIMRDNDLLWRPPPEKPTRTHDGTVMVPESDHLRNTLLEQRKSARCLCDGLL